MTTEPTALLRRTEAYLSALHGSVARHDSLAANLACAGCELRDEIRAALAAEAPTTTKPETPEIQVWPLKRVLAEVRCGSEDWSWEEEWADLDRRHADTGYLAKLEEAIRENGITMPVLVGSDGRLWDGHHRLRLAVRIGIDYVPVEVVPPTAKPETEPTLEEIARANVLALHQIGEQLAGIESWMWEHLANVREAAKTQPAAGVRQDGAQS